MYFRNFSNPVTMTWMNWCSPLQCIGFPWILYRLLTIANAIEEVEQEISVDLNTKENLYSPIGLDIGAETPEEIAIAVTAEIIAVFRERNADFLKNRVGSIHVREI